MRYLVLLILLLVGCSSHPLVNKEILIEPEMDREEVISLMGYPFKREFTNELEEWHYHANTNNGDGFVVLVFKKGELIEKFNYAMNDPINRNKCY